MKSSEYNTAYNTIREALLDEFFGPPDTGRFSAGVQQTLFRMGTLALKRVSAIDGITISLPNIHFLPCNIPVFAKNDIKFEDDVYIATDEPHGIISATINRKLAAKL